MTKIQVARKRQYRQYDENVLNSVITAIKNKEISINKAAKKFKISKGTLVNKVNNKHTKSVGCPLGLTETEEDTLIGHIVTVAQWGFPFDKRDLCHLTQLYLDKCGRNVRQFKDNLPTYQWAGRFLKRHHKELSNKKCQNLKRNKAELKADAMQAYFDNLRETLTEEDGSFVPPHRIFNYDETNLSDDPGTKRCIFKRGVKYPERVMDSSKSSTSLMFCGSGTGALLPPYVVYKSKNLYSEWTTGGPAGTRYNRSKSGWFVAIIFRDWFEQTFVSYIKDHKLNEEGKVVIIGDNLSSHFSPEVLQLCEDYNISFVCLPKNSTHLAQPLDVSFYGPLKTYWRGVLEKWKKGLQKKSQTITKEKFPSLMNKVYVKICGNEAQSDQLVSGFKKTGIFPFNPNEVISRLPGSTTEENAAALVSESVLEMLKDLRSGDSSEKKPRKTKLNVKPGKSIGFEDLPKLLTPVRQDNKAEKLRKKLQNMVKSKKKTTGEAKKKIVEAKKKTIGEAKKKTIGDAKKKRRMVNRGKTMKTVKRKPSIRKIASGTDVVGDSDDSITVATTKKKLGCGRRKMLVVTSDSDESEMECTTMKRFSGRVHGSTEQISGKTKVASTNELVRPSISEIVVDDYVLVEYIMHQNKKHYIGIVKRVGRDVLGVTFLHKRGSKFTFSQVVEEATILPTQIVKILQPPKLEHQNLIFEKHDVHGFKFF